MTARVLSLARRDSKYMHVAQNSFYNLKILIFSPLFKYLCEQDFFSFFLDSSEANSIDSGLESTLMDTWLPTPLIVGLLGDILVTVELGSCLIQPVSSPSPQADT